jgi:copper transport protein
MKKLSALILSSFFFLLSISIVWAHASLIKADPPPNAILSAAPNVISLWFDEELDTNFSSVTLLDKNQTRVDLQNLQFSTDRKQLTIGVRRDLPLGAYTVSWRVLSAVDGHITQGIYAIFLGKDAVSQVVIVAEPQEASVLPLPFEVAIRWVNLLAAIALCGAFTLAILMSGDRSESLRQRALRRYNTYVISALVVLFIGIIVAQVLQAAAAASTDVLSVLQQSIWLQTLTTTRFGQAGLARILLVDSLLVLFAVSSNLVNRWRIKRLKNMRAFDLLYWTLSVLVLLTFSLASHGANDPTKIALVMDWGHLLAIGLWTGGVFALTVIVRPVANMAADGEALLNILRRFSQIAIISVGLFALTGLYSMWRQVGYAHALVGTQYGVTLIVKHIFIMPLLLLGLVNTLLLHPDWQKFVSQWAWLRAPIGWVEELAARISQVASRKAPSAVFQYARLEAVLGALTVCAAAAMTALPPARTAVPPPLPPPFEAQRASPKGDMNSGLNVTLKIDPYVVGNQTFNVRITDAQGQPVSNVTRVTLRFTFLGADLGTTSVEAPLASDGTYRIEGGYLSVVGAWKAETIIRRKDIADDVRLAYRLNVIDPATQRSELPDISSGLLFAIVDLLGGIALLVYARQKQLPEGQWIGGGAIALGIVLFIMTTFFSTPASANILVNPLAPDEASLAQGKIVYEQNCLACHGVQGRGNGPLGLALNPRPSDFAIHVNQHSDEALFNWISQGVPGTAMQGFADKLTETQRWHVLNYIQALVEKGQ